MCYEDMQRSPLKNVFHAGYIYVSLQSVTKFCFLNYIGRPYLNISEIWSVHSVTECTWSGSGCKLLRYGAAAVSTWSISRSCKFRCTAISPILLSSSFWSLKSWVNLYDEPLSFFLLSRQDLVKIWHRGGNTCLKRKQYTLYHTANKQPNKK